MDSSIISPIVNFVVVIGILYFAGRKPFSHFLSARSEQIRSALDEARDADVEARAWYSKWSECCGKIPVEAKEIHAEVTRQLELVNERGMALVRMEKERLEKELVLTEKTEYARAAQQLEREVTSKSVAVARIFLKGHLGPEAGKKLMMFALEGVSGGRAS
jgi:F0F1-type ATP synthase membrane subunit b/b'